MELRQLRYFVAVAEELHFGRAAEKLRMSQPPLSVQVSKLEREVGLELFERSTRKVSLTPAGVHLRERAQSILDEVDSVRDEMREYIEGRVGPLNVGFVSSANYTVLPQVTQSFRALHAGVDLSLVPLTSSEQIERLHQGTLDIAIVRDEFPPTVPESVHGFPLRAEIVFEEPLVACLPNLHPLTAQAEVTPEQIVGLPMITYPSHLMQGFTNRVMEIFAPTGQSITVAEEVVHQETALGFVAAGAGISILPASVRQLVPPSITVLPISGAPTSQLLAVRRMRASELPSETAFLECLRVAARGLSAMS